MKWIRNHKGLTAMISVIVLLASLMIGAIVFSQLSNQVKSLAQQYNDTTTLDFVNSAITTGYSALNMFIIGAIVMAAGFILALLVAWGRSSNEM